MNIDLKTGLPELPEGWWWKVERSRGRHAMDYGYGWVERDAIQVVLVHDEESITRRIFRKDLKSTISVRVASSVVERELTPARIEPGINRVTQATYDREVTPENILHTAKQIMVKYEAMKIQKYLDEKRQRELAREKARIDALLGSYPPKRLEVSK